MPTPVELVTSYAYRDGDSIKLVMDLPGFTTTADEIGVQLRRGKQVRRVQGAASSTALGTRLDVVVPGRALGRRAWRLAIQADGDADYRPIQARLLARQAQPVALLTGPVPTTRMAEPTPRPRKAAPVSPTARARAVVGRLRRRLQRT